MHEAYEELFFEAVKYFPLLEPYLPTVIIFLIGFLLRWKKERPVWEAIIAIAIVPYLISKFKATYVEPLSIIGVTVISYGLG